MRRRAPGYKEVGICGTKKPVIAVALAATFITDRAINLEQSDGSQASKYLKR